ncbi:hypothetical protein niasHT_027471 [Heterodera trifolii]|uniref:Fido domain-containing protein n=1 Tax=Heterodera trifolii TaxID=157864 RepID=A0ABD2JMK7_9BILA
MLLLWCDRVRQLFSPNSQQKMLCEGSRSAVHVDVVPSGRRCHGQMYRQILRLYADIIQLFSSFFFATASFHGHQLRTYFDRQRWCVQEAVRLDFKQTKKQIVVSECAPRFPILPHQISSRRIELLDGHGYLNVQTCTFSDFTALPWVLTTAGPLIIHPHRDANGRVSRLFANLLLMRRGLNTISYLPAVPAQESQYYDALVAASTHNNPMPFINFVSAMIQNHNW